MTNKMFLSFYFLFLSLFSLAAQMPLFLRLRLLIGLLAFVLRCVFINCFHSLLRTGNNIVSHSFLVSPTSVHTRSLPPEHGYSRSPLHHNASLGRRLRALSNALQSYSTEQRLSSRRSGIARSHFTFLLPLNQLSVAFLRSLCSLLPRRRVSFCVRSINVASGMVSALGAL